jgi:hypothetical protein
MSTPNASDAALPDSTKDVDRRRSLGKYVKRMSSVFKREKSSKSSAASTPTAPSTPAPAPAPAPIIEQKEEEATPAAADAAIA